MSKLNYISPVDVSQLFMVEQISTTINHLISSFVKEVEERESNGEIFAYPIIGYELNRKINVDYAYMIKKFSELFNNPELFIDDFSITDDSDKGKRNNLFLVHSLLENLLGLVSMNSTKIVCKYKGTINYSPSYYIPLIIKRGNYYAQMASVSFVKNAFKEYLNEELNETFNMLIFEGSCEQLDKVYGAKQCFDFWSKSGTKPRHIAII